MSRASKNLLVAVPVTLIFLVIAVPNFFPARVTKSRSACCNNLSWIQKAKIKWAQDLNKPNTAVPTEDDLRPVLKALGAGDFFPGCSCPDGGKYTIGAVREPVKCSRPGHTLPAD